MSAKPIVLAAPVVYQSTGRRVRAHTWGEPQSYLYELLSGPQTGESGPMEYLADLVGGAPLVVHWLAVTRRSGVVLLKTRRGYRPIREVVA